MSPEEMDTLKEACCNGFSNTQSECLAYHGMKSYTVTVWPKDIAHRLQKDWHQFTVVSVIAGKRYVVIDCGTAFVHDGSLQSLIATHYPHQAIMPNGVQEWRRLRDHPFAKFGSHILYGGVTEDQMTSYPELVPENAERAYLPRRKESPFANISEAFKKIISACESH